MFVWAKNVSYKYGIETWNTHFMPPSCQSRGFRDNWMTTSEVVRTITLCLTFPNLLTRLVVLPIHILAELYCLYSSLFTDPRETGSCFTGPWARLRVPAPGFVSYGTFYTVYWLHSSLSPARRREDFIQFCTYSNECCTEMLRNSE
jgi:hypothetical protein